MSILNSRKLLAHTGNIKAFLFLFSIALIVAILVYTQSLVEKLRHEASSLLHFYASIYARAASDINTQDYSFIFEEIIQRIEFPIIISQERNGKPSAWKNIGIPPDDFSPETIQKVEKILRKMDKAVKPIEVKYGNLILGYIHYGDSRLILQLRRLPYIEIALVGIFILLGYAGFTLIRNLEKRNIWVGMAKETAHQLGTPLSSLLGWIEILREDPNSLNKVLPEINTDVKRLKKISQRFSQIGSSPRFQRENLRECLLDTVNYIKKRLPHLGKNVSIIIENDEDLNLEINRELLEWALENVIKNALDAITTTEGSITIRYFPDKRLKTVTIDIIDTGKGIPKKNWRDIFRPGYSTKERGWGMGLSLTKRIIEDYHRGYISVHYSQPDRGTCIRIILPLLQKR